jgi:hypothetical protein
MFIFGLHCHQPVDNFGFVVDKAVEDCYRPLFERLYKYPNFKFAVHFSGWLFEYIRKNANDLFAMLQDMAKNHQVEFFSGGFYEPILEAIPSDDRKLQIKRMNNYIRKHFAQNPKGLWLAERVYSDCIVKDIVDSGIDYIALDDTFIDRFSYVEVDGYILKILPISKKLRYNIPFKSIDSVIELIEGKDVNVIFDDCEKFGVWPGTKEWVYDEGWLDAFLAKNIKTVLPKEFVKKNIPTRVALPNHSYQEMEEWSLDNKEHQKYIDIKNELSNKKEDAVERYLRGGVWKNFLNRYFEANWIQKRVWYLSYKKLNNKHYLDSLFKAQCNDVLWHGVFGGVYLPNLRDNAYKYIIECENMLKSSGLEKLDIDFNLQNEFKYNGENYIAIFNSKGEMVEFDDRKSLFNFQNTLRRYQERYHKQSKEEVGFDTIHNKSFDFSKYPIKFDKYFNFSFVTEDDIYKSYSKNSKIEFVGEKIKKVFKFKKDRIDFLITNSSKLQFCLHFANNFKLSKSSQSIEIFDEFTKRTIKFKFDSQFQLKEEDVITYSLKESGLDSIKQGVLFMFEFESNNIEGSLCLK